MHFHQNCYWTFLSFEIWITSWSQTDRYLINGKARYFKFLSFGFISENYNWFINFEAPPNFLTSVRFLLAIPLFSVYLARTWDKSGLSTAVICMVNHPMAKSQWTISATSHLKISSESNEISNEILPWSFASIRMIGFRKAFLDQPLLYLAWQLSNVIGLIWVWFS